MGMIVDLYKFRKLNQRTNYLIIYCLNSKSLNELEKKAYSINKPLAEKLLNIKPPGQRSMKIETCFNEIINSLPDSTIIKDFDVMFNPNYEIDILTILISAFKRKNFSVLWSGTLNDDKLMYSEENLQDYHKYDIQNYDIMCVKS